MDQISHFYDGRFSDVEYDLRLIESKRWPTNREEACVKWIDGGKSLLEIGFGDGNLLYTLSRRFNQVCGVEVSPNRISNLMTAFQNAGIDNVSLYAADVEKSLPFPDDSFDCIVWCDVVEHVLDPYAAMESIVRILKPGGRLVSSTPNIAEIRRRLKLLFGRFPATACEENEGFDMSMREPYDRGHLHYFTHRGIENLHQMFQLKVCKRFGFGNAGRLHDLYPPLLSGTIFTIAEKPLRESV